MHGVTQIEKALRTLREHIQQTINNIGLIFGQIVFKVFQGEIRCMDVDARFTIAPPNKSAPSQISLNFQGAFDFPESVQWALETLMVSKFGMLVVDIKEQVVKSVWVCSQIRFAQGA
jgi:hypothetical protein